MPSRRPRAARLRWTATASALALALAVATRADPVFLDFGSTESPVRDGFVRVTETTAFEDGAGAGWVEPQGLVSRAVAVQREWTYSESGGRSNPPSVYATDLSCDHVESVEPASLRVRVADGPVRVWLLCGVGGGNSAQVWDVSASAGGSEVRATFPGATESRTLDLRANASGGVLDIRFSSRSRWLVSAAVVAPESAWSEAAASVVAAVEREVFMLPEEVLKDWRHVPHEEPVPDTAFSEPEQERGFVVYRRHYLTPVWPDSVPRRAEIDPALRAFASLDEYEPLTFTIHPLRSFASVDVEVSDLVSTSGARLRADGIDVRYVRYMWVRPNYRVFGSYHRAPDVLMPWGPRPLTAGENLRVWLTVYVGPADSDDVYRGEARIRAGNEVVARVPIVFRVLPIKLQKDRTLAYGQYYRRPYDAMFRAPDAFSRDWWRRKAELEHEDMAAHGNNTLVLGLGGRAVGDGRWRFDFDRLGHSIDLYYRYGFHHPIVCHFPVGSLYLRYMQAGMGSHLRLIKMPPPPFFEELTAMVRAIEAERKRRQWPELLYYPVDEPSRSPVSVQFMAAVMKAIKEVPGVRTYVTADPAHEEFAPMRPYVDVWCCQPFSLERETVLADMEKRGVEYWCYPNHVAGENDHTPVAGARMTYGFGFWRSGFRALTPWIYQAIIGDQWNYLDGGAMDFFNRTADDGSPIPVALWEAYREGIDDGRYVNTLDRWIERAREAGLTQELEEAEADRKLLWDSIEVQPKYKHDGLWDAETFDVFRWLLANQVLRLRGAVEGR